LRPERTGAGKNSGEKTRPGLGSLPGEIGSKMSIDASIGKYLGGCDKLEERGREGHDLL